MSYSLKCHPDTPCAVAIRIEVDVARPRPGHLALRYVVSGAVSDIRLPPPAAPARTDELWRHTCFEAFLPTPDGYCEFNFAPSTQWAAYRFDGYRSGMRDLEDFPPPRIALEAGALVLEATLDLSRIVAGDAGLCAVIEDKSGGKSYWALAHPPGKPDFHHPDCFVLELPAA